MLDTNKFKSFVVNDKARAYKRGFIDLEMKLLDAQQQVNEITTILELGIGSGRKQEWWNDATTNNTLVAGVDHFDFRHEECAEWNKFDKWKRNQLMAEESFATRPRIKPLYRFTSYSTDTVKAVHSALNTSTIDVILDDSCEANYPAQKDALPVWKSSLSPTGCFISETPDGNGTPAWRSVSHEQRMQNFAELTEMGMIIFDMSEYRTDPQEDFASNYLGFYAHDLSVYQSVIDEYSKHILK